MTKSTRDTLFSSDKNNWETPQALFDELNAKYHFTLDAAASLDNHKVDRFYTPETNGLAQDWGGRSSSAILHMVIKKQENGQRNATKSPVNLVQLLFC